jgi:hypothetical protein
MDIRMQRGLGRYLQAPLPLADMECQREEGALISLGEITCGGVRTAVTAKFRGGVWWISSAAGDFPRAPDDGRCLVCEGWGCPACGDSGGY